MKIVSYSIIFVLLVALGLFTIYSYAHVTQPVEKATKCKTEVYVDIDRLITLHPASTIVSAMKQTVADSIKMPSATGPIESTPQLLIPKDVVECNTPIDTKLEKRLDAELAQKTKTELDRLETERLQAMSARIKQNRETRVEEASSELNAGIRDIRTEESAQLQALAKQYSLNRINAHIKVNALKAAQDPKVDNAGLASSLAEYESSMDKTESAYASEETKIKNIYQDKVDTLQKSISDKIDSSIAEYESKEKVRIGTSIASARKEIIAGISKTTSIDGLEGVSGKGIGGNIERSARAAASVSNVNSIKASQTTQSLDNINAKIRADIIRMVKSIAAEKNMKVSFVKGHGKDATGLFGSMIKERGWTASAPVLSSWNGS